MQKIPILIAIIVFLVGAGITIQYFVPHPIQTLIQTQIPTYKIAGIIVAIDKEHQTFAIQNAWAYDPSEGYTNGRSLLGDITVLTTGSKILYVVPQGVAGGGPVTDPLQFSALNIKDPVEIIGTYDSSAATIYATQITRTSVPCCVP